ncbi:hypothetical protein NDN08_001874 [Rhodosorus marinus]|uniref:Ubiquitin-like domain-containing protein n=1 Tax=Rhodosorus marinus TaxID=101924 RepID=A0AAV8UWE1_9RHOD|nr:hypothetical protein NDN08_001874 [Rhodosorus marinus]
MELRSVTNDEYVRVERPNRTTLITIDLSASTTVDLKKKISDLFNIPEKSMQLYLQDVPQDRELKKLDDPVLLSAQGVSDGAAVLLVCLKDDGVWEDINSLIT